MNFLSFEEQLQDIKDKINSKKYKTMKFQCELCGIGFLTNELFVEHKKRHVKCELRGIGFLTNDLFVEHKKRHVKSAGEHECRICKLRFKTRDVLTQHSLAHKRRFTCLVCGLKFRRWSYSIAHRYKCSTAPNFVPCNHCTKVFSDLYSRNIHIQGVHKSLRKHCCDQCEQTFNTKHKLYIHMRVHTGSKPFACEQCERTFASNSNLRAHHLVHENTKTYYCVECDTYYKSEKSLKRHFESVKHLNKGEGFRCPECFKNFCAEKKLKTHVELKHLQSIKHNCIQCKKNFSNKGNLNKHQRKMHSSLAGLEKESNTTTS